jgi:hypothetical protein
MSDNPTPLPATAMADARQALLNAQQAVLYGQLGTVSRQLILLGNALNAIERERAV